MYPLLGEKQAPCINDAKSVASLSVQRIIFIDLVFFETGENVDDAL